MAKKWPNYGYFEPKTANVMEQKNIFINLSWHVGYGPLLSPFEVLEVPKTDNSPIV